MTDFLGVYIPIAFMGCVCSVAAHMVSMEPESRDLIKWWTIFLFWPIAIPVLGIIYLWQDRGLR